jgi:GT2 family glycosyltransferase
LDFNGDLPLSSGARHALADYQQQQGNRAEEQASIINLSKLNGQQERKIDRVKIQLGNLRKELNIERNKIIAKQNEIDARENEVSRLSSTIEQLSIDTNAAFNSKRWKLGNAILSIPYTVIRRAPPELATKNIERTLTRHQQWTRQKALLEKAEQENHATDVEAPKPYTPIDEGVLQKKITQYHASTKKKRIAVYTSIVGGYDELKTPEDLNPECDYICFTDQPEMSHPVWQCRPTLYFNADQTRIARYYKLHPHAYLHDYEITVWVDANILIRNDFTVFLDRFIAGDNPVGTFKHYKRFCTYDEANECLGAQKDDQDIILKQINQYAEEGLPRNFGLPETNIFISRPNDPLAKRVFQTWWEQLDNGSRRDQLSIMYSLWKNDCSYTALNDDKSQMARFDRVNFELFNHQTRKSFSHPSIYKTPSFIDVITEKVNYVVAPKTKTDSVTVDIIIPVHNALDDVKNCLNSVITKLNRNKHRVLIVDDGSDSETRDYLLDFQKKHSESIIMTRNQHALGYTKAANIGMKLSSADYVILLNSDTVVANNWVEKMVSCAMSSSSIGIVGPLSNAASWQSVPLIKESDGSYSNNPLPAGVNVNTMDHWCASQPSFYPRVQLVNGFCFLITRQLINAIGIFDELSYPKGYNEENDYCFRCSDHGFELAIATDTYVYHAKSKSYTPQKRLLLCEESRVVFEGRYGKTRISRATESLRLNPYINKVRENIAKDLANV